MDAVSAVGLAAAIAQFLAIAFKATGLCLEIRDNSNSATDHNESLEAYAREIKKSRAELTTNPPNQVPRRIKELSSKCVQLTDEIIQLLEHVRGSGSNIGTLRKVHRAMKANKRIEKLENSLRDKEKILGSLLIQDIWRRFDLESVRQTQEFSKLDAKAKEILENLAQHQQKADSNAGQLGRELQSVRIGASRRLNQLDAAAERRHRKAEAAAERRSTETQRRLEESNEQRLIDKVLNSLFYPEINERYSSIKAAAPGTFEWIFKDPEPMSSTEINFKTWKPVEDNFRLWLRDPASVYWINGKLGSGKSTLMAHIVNHPHTKKELEIWSQGYSLHILSFFFWRAGTQLQKSILGLLRGLLYQICMCDQEKIRGFLSLLSIDIQRIPVWTERSLKTAITTALLMANDTRFCVFMDGLDEFTGDYNELLDLIFEIQEHSNIKLCVSSRPELQLSNRLSKCRQLRLQDLNRHDIVEHVGQKLRTIDVQFPGTKFLKSIGIVELIASRAEGVFLWAVLVSQALVRGAISGEDEGCLRRRIEAIPPGINELFQVLIRDIDQAHKDALAFYLMVMKIITEFRASFNICVITAARIGTMDGLGDSFLPFCQQTEAQIIAHARGILEISSYAPDPASSNLGSAYYYSEAAWCSGSDWFRLQNHPDWTGAVDAGSSLASGVRERFSGPYPQYLRHEMRFPAWTHRSAYEFMSDPTNVEMLRLPKLKAQDVLRNLLQAATRYISTAPSFRVRSSTVTLTNKRLENLMLIRQKIESRFPSIALATVDHLRRPISEMSPREFSLPVYDLKRYPRSYAFWMSCFMEYPEYVVDRLDEVPPELYSRLLRACHGHMLKNINLILDKISATFSKTSNPSQKSTQFFCAPYTEAACDMSCEVTLKGQDSDRFEVEMLNVTELSTMIKRSWLRELQPLYGEGESRSAYHRLQDLSRKLNLYQGIGKCRNRLHLQISVSPLFGYSPRKKIIDHVLSQNCTEPENPIRFFCCPWRIRLPFARVDDLDDPTAALVNVDRYVILVPRLATSWYLLQFLTLKRHQFSVGEFGNWGDGNFSGFPLFGLRMKRRELELCFEMVEEDVLVNEQGLDATQQLFALACVRTYLKPLLESMWVDSENPGDQDAELVMFSDGEEAKDNSGLVNKQETSGGGTDVLQDPVSDDGNSCCGISENAPGSDDEWSTEDCWESDEGE